MEDVLLYSLYANKHGICRRKALQPAQMSRTPIDFSSADMKALGMHVKRLQDKQFGDIRQAVDGFVRTGVQTAPSALMWAQDKAEITQCDSVHPCARLQRLTLPP